MVFAPRRLGQTQSMAGQPSVQMMQSDPPPFVRAVQILPSASWSAMCEYWIARWAGMNVDFFLTEGQWCTGLRLDLRFGRGAPSPEHRSPGSLPPNLLSPSSFFRRIYIIPSCLKGGNAPGWNCFLKSMKEILHWTSANFDGSPSKLWHLS